MSRATYSFKETDVTRAYRATRKAGAVVDRVEIDRSGKIIIVIENAQSDATVQAA
jgi:hypothetical protein